MGALEVSSGYTLQRVLSQPSVALRARGAYAHRRNSDNRDSCTRMAFRG